MDVNEITKVAGRKRLNVDAEKLREKVSRETTKIIKLKVAQDTAYWDLKEKLQQVEGNHERLQQNMVEVQMQHEAISGQYQDELRLRPDTLNKLSTTRDICDVLEEYSERLKDTLSRCKSDQASLCDAYQKSGRLVRGIKRDCEREREKQNLSIKFLSDKAVESAKHHEKLAHHYNVVKQKSDVELSEARETMREMRNETEGLVNKISELTRQLEHYKSELVKKDESIVVMQEQTANSLEVQSSKLRDMISKLEQKETELKATLEAMEEQRIMISTHERQASELRVEKEDLLDKIASIEGKLRYAEDGQKQLTENLEASYEVKHELERKIANMTGYTVDLEKVYAEKELIAKQEKCKLELQIDSLKAEKNTLTSELKGIKELCLTQEKEMKALRKSYDEIRAEKENIEIAYNQYKRDNEEKQADLKRLNEEKEKDVVSKASTIAQLMCEVGTAGETAARLEATLQKIREESDLERQAFTEKEGIHKRQIENIQSIVSEKENELSKQMTIILDMRSEKDRLQEKIQNMQSKIDNIQKELSEPHPRLPVGDAPELDDNAVAFAPTPRAPPRANAKPQLMKSPVLKPQKKHKLADNGKLDSMLFSMFSDTSMDEDSNMIDRHEVDRRFEALARGEPLPPTSINSLKRRKAPSSGLRLNEEEDISLSQVKKSMKSNEPRKFFKNMRVGNKK